MAPSPAPADVSSPPSSPGPIAQALGNIPGGVWVLTSRVDDRRRGLLVGRVQQLGSRPPVVAVAVPKGEPIMPLLSDSGRFALCQLGEEDRRIRRKFSTEPEEDEDPFLGLRLADPRQAGLPIVETTVGHLECSIVRHLDFEGDHDLFIGEVVSARRGAGLPLVRLRDDGLEA
ncbi:flavin reductase family protein [Phycisphaera mikurensis]|uniref:Putative oxidoreductase n=1 Tax=Phycisphaera mikurensis (strain NBRC 102666 / KCTC 22515 / FYK2301M01) TaxID=1142394 RepID=I0IAW7_PHYMF|nr:flavin reductase family protein [Phycisphaera mikurensis]MBB6442621.1 flavin reductase (DIM6/NTAB) family NADH-FMN oxidoreductase RutF [Phycisphaera mikurensis]BAM02405.1 putative oxidoreductase [Phycisphaera mikurensis NBRC 102666]